MQAMNRERPDDVPAEDFEDEEELEEETAPPPEEPHEEPAADAEPEPEPEPEPVPEPEPEPEPEPVAESASELERVAEPVSVPPVAVDPDNPFAFAAVPPDAARVASYRRHGRGRSSGMSPRTKIAGVGA